MNPDLSIVSLGKALRAGEFTSVELTRLCLQRAEASSNGAWRSLTAERALKMAERADRLFAEGQDLGPLHGIPAGIKDNINMAGEVSLAGMDPLLPLRRADADASLVVRLELAGAVIIGRTNMTELAYTALGLSPRQTPLNPRDRERVPGGSSSGSAVAVAAGEVPFALGTDTGGSVRIPAAYTGITGLKPGNGRLDLRGVFPLSSSLDTVGPMTRTARDAELVFSMLDPAFTSEPRMGVPRILIPETVVLDDLDPEVAEDFEQAVKLFDDLNAVIDRRPLPLLQEVIEARRYGSFAGWEAYRMYGELLRSGADQIEVAEAVLAYAERDLDDYQRLQERRSALRRQLRQEFADYDLILSPTVAGLPPLLSEVQTAAEQEERDSRGLRNTQLFNFLGLPVLALPMGELTSLSIAAHEGKENLVLAAGKAFEEARA